MLNIDKNLIDTFEHIILTQKEEENIILYKSVSIYKHNFNRVINNKGEYCLLNTTGNNMENWYIYHTLKDKIVYIIEIYLNLMCLDPIIKWFTPINYSNIKIYDIDNYFSIDIDKNKEEPYMNIPSPNGKLSLMLPPDDFNYEYPDIHLNKKIKTKK